MSIKNIRDFMKGKSKKRIIGIAAASLGGVLILSNIPIKNAVERSKEEQFRVAQQKLEEEKGLTGANILITDEELEQLLEKLSKEKNILIADDIRNLTEELSSNSCVNVSYQYYSPGGNYLEISAKEDYEGKKVLTADFYEKLNLLIKKGNVNSILFYNLDTYFDLAKVDCSNMDRRALRFNNYDGELDCSFFTGNFTLEFTNTKAETASKILSNCDVSEAVVEWNEEVVKSSELSALLQFLTENNTSIRSFTIEEKNKENYSGITKEEFDLISKVNANYISIESEGFTTPLHLDLTLNPSIESLHIATYKEYIGPCEYVNGELGTIKIDTSNPNFRCYFSHVDITKNTHFSLPDSSRVCLRLLNCTDISAFKDLKNVTCLEFKEDTYGDGPADLQGEIYYDATGTYTPMWGESVYCSYNEMLKDLEYYFKLSNLREKLNLASSKYYNMYTFGDYVNLVDDNVDVYKTVEDLAKQQNEVSSYYGTSEIRCVRSICMAKEEIRVEVDNMEDYEYYLNEGYILIGYNLVNQYSNTPNDCELYCSENALELVHTPFNNRR